MRVAQRVRGGIARRFGCGITSLNFREAPFGFCGVRARFVGISRCLKHGILEIGFAISRVVCGLRRTADGAGHIGFEGAEGVLLLQFRVLDGGSQRFGGPLCGLNLLLGFSKRLCGLVSLGNRCGLRRVSRFQSRLQAREPLLHHLIGFNACRRTPLRIASERVRRILLDSRGAVDGARSSGAARRDNSLNRALLHA